MGSKYDDSAVVELTGKIMVIAIIILFLVILLVFFLHLYAKWFWYRLDDQNPPSRRRRRRRQDGSVGEEAEDEEVVSVSLGLDPIILKSIPIVKFNPKDGELECAVCLSELAAGENARLLPKCSHGFHVECIDMWFHSHSTCPLCRNPISILNQMIQIPPPENQSSSSSIVTVNVTGTETPNFPTNVLFWGNESQVSTLGACLDEDDRRNRHSIQIPIQNPSSSSDGGGMGIEEEDSKSPLPARMRSFKRLLSRDRRVNPSNVDLEQGSRSQA